MTVSSIIFDADFGLLTGLYIFKSVFSPFFLCTGVTFEHFQDCGNSPLEIELLMMYVKGAAITSSEAFSILGLTKSSPDEVFGFKHLIAFLTCTSVTSRREKCRFLSLYFSFSFDAGSIL